MTDSSSAAAMLEVVELGRATTIQDDGRGGHADIGVPRSGALDQALADRLNRLVGNPVGAAVLETLGGAVVRSNRPIEIAGSAESGRRSVPAGDLVHIDPVEGQLWGYLAVRGGIAVPPVFGSRSHDTLSALGPPPLRPGALLPIGGDPGTPLLADLAPVRTSDAPIRLWPGPRTDRFVDGIRSMTGRRWQVSSDISRVGCRLAAQPFEMVPDAPSAMPSEGLIRGAIQVTSAGEPIVMLADHPTTGGYPVIAVVEPADLGRFAQLRPGTAVRFVEAVGG